MRSDPYSFAGISPMEGWMLVASFFDSFKEGVLTWLPLVFFGLLVYLVWRTLAIMPRVKPQTMDPSLEVVGDLGRRRGCRRGARGVPGGRRVPAGSEALLAARRARPEGHPPLRLARHGEDAARQGRGARVGRDLLLPERVGVRRDVRRARRRADPQALRHRAPQPAGDRVHRRARRRRYAPLGPLVQPRARPDLEPAARRARRLRGRGPGRDHRRLEPARGPRPGPAPAGPLRSPDPRLAARPRGSGGDPPRAHARQAAGSGGRSEHRRAAHRRASPAPTWRTSATRRRSQPAAARRRRSPSSTSTWRSSASSRGSSSAAS